MDAPDITVIICTHGRLDSLRETLAFLARDDCGDLRVEVIVVENGGEAGTRDIVEEMREAIPVRYVYEPREGKEFALNRGIGEPGLGELVVFLDDDMSPEAGWWGGVKAISDRHPDCDYFTGRSRIVWPREDIPGWARDPAVQAWAHSVLDWGPADRRFGAGTWPSGNMFWVRRRVLERGFRFDESLHPRYSMGVDADFILQLAEAGLQGVAGGDVVVGHRVQEALLDEAHVRERAIRMGRALSRIRLDKPKTLRQAQLFQDRPLIFRTITAANLARWLGTYARAWLKRNRDARIAAQMVALVGIVNNWEALRMRRR